MAKTKTASKKKTLRQEVTELKDSLAQLVNALSANVQTNTPAPIVQQGGGKRGRSPKRKVVEDENDTGRGMRQGQSPHLKKKIKTPATVQAITTGPRPNLFEKMNEFSSYKEDTKIDKKLWKGRKPVPRGERSTVVDIVCDGCNYEFTISPNELKRTMNEDGHMEDSYTCNDCIRSKH